MKQRILSFLLVCFMLIAMLSACDEDDAPEMTAVPLETTEASETTEPSLETEATAASEERKYQPVQTAPPTEATAEPTEQTEQTEETYAPVTESAPPETEAPTETFNSYNIACGCVGGPVSILYALIGYPPYGSSYSPQFNSNGENGELYYDGFTVYTYREHGEETVEGVSR